MTISRIALAFWLMSPFLNSGLEERYKFVFQWSYTPYWQTLPKDLPQIGIIMPWTPSPRGQTVDRCQGEREADEASASWIMYQQENMTGYITEEKCEVWWGVTRLCFILLGSSSNKKKDAVSSQWAGKWWYIYNNKQGKINKDIKKRPIRAEVGSKQDL